MQRIKSNKQACVTVNSGIFARVLFSRNFAPVNINYKTLAKSLDLQFTDESNSGVCLEFLTLQTCLLTLFAKISENTVYFLFHTNTGIASVSVRFPL